MIGPYAQQTDLQIIGVFKHKLAGDTYISAMKDFDDKLSGLLSSLRNRGEFVGELGETVLFKPPTGSIVPARVSLSASGPNLISRWIRSGGRPGGVGAKRCA